MLPLSAEEVASFDGRLKVQPGTLVPDEGYKGRLLAYLVKNPAQARSLTVLSDATLVSTLAGLVPPEGPRAATSSASAAAGDNRLSSIEQTLKEMKALLKQSAQFTVSSPTHRKNSILQWLWTGQEGPQHQQAVTDVLAAALGAAGVCSGHASQPSESATGSTSLAEPASIQASGYTDEEE